jgi:hypothetical protein
MHRRAEDGGKITATHNRTAAEPHSVNHTKINR